jgi:NADH:ubiquinone oxidoreductase subunit K
MFWKIVLLSLFLSAFIAFVNIGGRNLIVFLLTIELMFFTASVTCLVYFYSNPSAYWNYDLIFAAIAITVLAAAESAVALALIARIHKKTRSIIIKKKIY